MLKKNYGEAVERNKRFLKRELMNGILLKTHVYENPYAISEDRDRTWGDRECLSVSDGPWVIENCRRNASVYQHIDDDTIPLEYPTLHFGESIYSGMLGGEMQIVGNDYHTCSGAKPLIYSMEDFEKLKNSDYGSNPWVKKFETAAGYFAEQARGDFCLRYVISIDALNFAVELLGTTEAYIALYDDEVLLRKIMEFGVDFNEWFYKLQKSIYEKNNRAALLDEEFYGLYDKAWYSIDAYTICDPHVYKKLGFEYQQELIRRVGGGMLHTHGTALLELLPYISKLEGLGSLQLGRDLYSQESLSLEFLPEARKMTGDTPLQVNVSREEFIEGVKNKSLPGGVEYMLGVSTIDEANEMAYMAKEYRAP